MRQRILIVLAVLVALGVIGVVAYLEPTNASTPSTTTSTTPTTLPSTTTSSTTIVSTSTTSTSTSSTFPPTTLPPADRGIIDVVVSSGSTAGEGLDPTVFFMSATGYDIIRGVDGSVPLVDSVVYYADGFQAAAEVLAIDAGLEITDVASLDDAPPVAGLGAAQLLLYLGGS